MKFIAVVVPRVDWAERTLADMGRAGFAINWQAKEATDKLTGNRFKYCVVGTVADTHRYRGLEFSGIEFHGTFHREAVEQMNALVRKDNRNA
jgi:hypothetical protein